MKHIGTPLLSLAAPLLIILAILGLLQRDGNARLHLLPALVVGSGLIISGPLGRSRRRKKLLLAIRQSIKKFS